MPAAFFAQGDAMRSGLLDVFSAISGKMPIVEWLDMSAFDELLELDIPADHYRIISHVDDKYAHAPVEGSFSELYHFVIDNLIHPDDLEAYKRFMDPDTMLDRLNGPNITGAVGILVNQMRFKTASGSWRWVEMCLVDGAQHGLPVGTVRYYLFDIQMQKDRLEPGSGETPALHPNREGKTGLFWGMPFIDKGEDLFKEVRGPQWCMIAIDIDHFRLFNDWYGRDTGDKLLSLFGQELSKAEKASGGVAGYMGQDDFCLLAPYVEERIAHLYTRLSDIIAQLATSIGFRPVFGVSVAEEDSTFMDLFDQARRALDYARGDFKIDINLYDPSMRELEDREYRVLVEFQRGLREKEFAVYLQPQCRMSTGKIFAAEALARWVKPDGTIVPPDEFVPILEKYGFVTDLDCFVWEHLCASIRAWIDKGNRPVPVSVNASQNDFYAIDVPAYFAHLIEEYNIPTELLKVEITESAIGENAYEVEDAVKQLREMGIMVLMDDFGSGYSSLNRLGGIEVDGIKLDAAFFRLDEAGKRKGIRIVESIINMAKTMAMPIICEGVETKEQVEFLEGLGCRFVQGYYFYEPMPEHKFGEFILDESVIDDEDFEVKLNEQLQMREFLDENVYSDAMLNTILGPVAYYLWHDDTIDIIRYNEQFYEAVGVPDFESRLADVPRFVPPEEVPRLFKLFENATNDLLNGASDVIGFFGRGDTLARFLMRAYYLGENDEGKRFYCSVRDVTETAEMQIQLKMLSNHLPMSVVFMRHLANRWHLQLILHGLANETGLSYEQFQSELSNGTVMKRIDPDDFERLKTSAFEALQTGEGFSGTFTLTDGEGEPRSFWLEAERANDTIGNGSFFLKFVAL